MTGPEKVLWKVLRKTGLHIRRQAPIGRYVADFACHEARLVIEVDGGWRDLEERQLSDAIRDSWLRTQGYRVLRFRDQQVFDDAEGVVQAIISTLPPRWGKGRDGGEPTALSEMTLEAPPHAPIQQTRALTPAQPSPIEGEGLEILPPHRAEGEGS